MNKKIIQEKRNASKSRGSPNPLRLLQQFHVYPSLQLRLSSQFLFKFPFLLSDLCFVVYFSNPFESLNLSQDSLLTSGNHFPSVFKSTPVLLLTFNSRVPSFIYNFFSYFRQFFLKKTCL